MTLRTKTLIIIGLTLIGLVLLLYRFTESLWLDGFETVEEEQIRQNMRQVRGAIDADLAALSRLASDYAGWDDTYDFIVNPTEAYRDSNLVDSTFADTGLNVMLFVDRQGRTVFGKAFDLGSATAVDLPTTLADVGTTMPHLLEHAATTSMIDGLVMVDGQPMLVSSHPILTSDKRGPIRGSLIMGWYITQAKLKEIEARTEIAPRPLRVGTSDLGPRDRAALARLKDTGDEALIDVQDSRAISGYALHLDLEDTPVLLMRIDRDREVYGEAQKRLTVFVLSLIVSGLIFGGVMIVLLEVVVLRRISTLGDAVRGLGEAGDPSARLAVRGHDELSDLTGRINETFDALERSQGALQYIGKHARCILWSATVRGDGEEPDDYDWDFTIQDEDAAQRVMPLDVFHGGSYSMAWKRSVHPEDSDRVRQTPVDAIRAQLNAFSQEFRMRGQDGADHWIHEEVDIERAEGDDEWRLVGVCTDLSARKNAEAEIQRARDAALEVSEMKSDFLANMSHEIRTPLNGIVGMAELLRDTSLTDEQREYLALINTSADGLLQVINDVLDFSKIEAGRLDLEEDDFQLRDTLGQAVSLLAVRAQQKGVELAYGVEPEVVDGLVGDSTRIRQILVNLVGNAIKFTEEGEVVVRVSAERVDERQVYLHFAVTDTGIGIPEEKQKVVFHAFRQADSSTTRQYGGTGLGLAISSQLAQRMHGRMWVESEAGRGSTFFFTALCKIQPGAVPPPAPAALAGKRVLLLDDNSANREIVQTLLESWQLDVTSAAAAGDATDALARGVTFDLTLCDAALPGADGFALARDLLAASDAGRVVMMLNALDRAGDAARCRELGVDGSVTKPIGAAELGATLVTALGLGDGDDYLAEAALAVPGAGGRTIKILLAEDNPVNQQVAVRLIERHGHTVDVVDDGQTAVDAIARGGYDVVLMDVQMPQLSGFEATALVRDRERAAGSAPVPIVAMTAHALKGDRARCLEAGMDGYVAKPISAAALFEEIARLVPDVALSPTPPPPVARDGARFDRDAALARLGGDESLLREVIDLFLGEYPAQLDALRRAADESDLETAKRTAHTLRGALSHLHADRATEACGNLEAAVDEGDGPALRESLTALECELDALRSSLG